MKSCVQIKQIDFRLIINIFLTNEERLSLDRTLILPDKSYTFKANVIMYVGHKQCLKNYIKTDKILFSFRKILDLKEYWSVIEKKK